MKKLLAPFIFCVHTPLQIVNLALWGTLVFLFGILKLLLPFASIRGWLLSTMHTFMHCFSAISIALIRFFNSIDIEFKINKNLSPTGWYLLIANHLSYLDIILLIEFTRKRIPPPKFFLKQELIWLPFVGLGAWALDMPFMKRYSRQYIDKHPEKKGQDIATTKRFCEKFKNQPTTVINFVEGTRFTKNKHRAKNSPYQRLLPPKAGGIAFTLATMGGLFNHLLDVSLLYPDNEKHPMMSMLCGQMTRIIVDVNVLPVPDEIQGDYYMDDRFKSHFQNWLNELWLEKDTRIVHLLESSLCK